MTANLRVVGVFLLSVAMALAFAPSLQAAPHGGGGGGGHGGGHGGGGGGGGSHGGSSRAGARDHGGGGSFGGGQSIQRNSNNFNRNQHFNQGNANPGQKDAIRSDAIKKNWNNWNNNSNSNSNINRGNNDRNRPDRPNFNAQDFHNNLNNLDNAIRSNNWNKDWNKNHGDWNKNHGDWNRHADWDHNRKWWYDNHNHWVGWWNVGVGWPLYGAGWWPGYYSYRYPYYYSTPYYGDTYIDNNYYSSTAVPYSAAYAPADSTVAQQPQGDMMDFYPQAVDAFQSGDYRNAVRMAGHASIDDPKNPQVHLVLSLGLFALGEYRGAAMEAHAVAALGKLPDWQTVYDLYGKAEPYTEQLRALEKAVNENPKSPENRFLLGFLYLIADHREAAQTQLLKALQLTPKDPIAAQLLTDAGGTVPEDIANQLKELTPPPPPSSETPE